MQPTDLPQLADPGAAPQFDIAGVEPPLEPDLDERPGLRLCPGDLHGPGDVHRDRLLAERGHAASAELFDQIGVRRRRRGDHHGIQIAVDELFDAVDRLRSGLGASAAARPGTG